MILSFWWISLELFLEFERWIEEGGAKEPEVSRFWVDELREGLLRKDAVEIDILLVWAWKGGGGNFWGNWTAMRLR